MSTEDARRGEGTEAGFIDVTKDHPIIKGSTTPRPITAVTGIVLHQTACLLGAKPARWHQVACHLGVPRDGSIIYVNKPETPMWHANGLNSSTVGIEVDGNFEGLDGNRRTCWLPGGGPHRATEEQILGARAAVRWIVEEVAAKGGLVSRIFAHRQSSDQRVADPGSRVWQEIGLWAQRELSLASEPHYTVGTGLPIPEEWDPRSMHRYRGGYSPRGVRWLQEALNAITGAGLEVDGALGPITLASLRRFQEQQDLKADGVVGPATRAALEELFGAPGAIA